MNNFTGSAEAMIDNDGDGFINGVEKYIGTDPNQKCQAAPNPAGVTAPNSAWNPDFNGDNKVDIFDVLAIKPHIGSQVGQLAYDQRFDLNADGKVDIFDVLAVKPYFGKSCVTL